MIETDDKYKECVSFFGSMKMCYIYVVLCLIITKFELDNSLNRHLS